VNQDRITYDQLSQLIDGRDRPAAPATTPLLSMTDVTVVSPVQGGFPPAVSYPL
jgi:hypothetical protein